MKYLILFWIALFASGSHALPMINLSGPGSTLGLNQTFTVEVLVSGVEIIDPLLAFGFDVDNDASLIFDGAHVASPFIDDSALFADTDVAGSTFPANDGASILLSTLSFSTGVLAGQFDISIASSTLDLGRSEGLFTRSDVYAIDERLIVDVAGTTPVPLPTTILLLCLGLITLCPTLRRY